MLSTASRVLSIVHGTWLVISKYLINFAADNVAMNGYHEGHLPFTFSLPVASSSVLFNSLSSSGIEWCPEN